MVVALVGRFINDVQLGLGTWLAMVGVLWAGSIAFVALGLLLGLSLDERAAGGAMSFVGVVLALLGGLLAPVEVFPESLRTLAHAMPSYWYAQLGRDVAAGSAPLGGGGPGPRRVHRRLRRPRGGRRPAPAALRRRRLSRATVPGVGGGTDGGRWAGRCPGCCSRSSRRPTW